MTFANLRDAQPVAVAVPAQPVQRSLPGHVWEWLKNASTGELVLTAAGVGAGLAIAERLLRGRREVVVRVVEPGTAEWDEMARRR